MSTYLNIRKLWNIQNGKRMEDEISMIPKKRELVKNPKDRKSIGVKWVLDQSIMLIFQSIKIRKNLWLKGMHQFLCSFLWHFFTFVQIRYNYIVISCFCSKGVESISIGHQIGFFKWIFTRGMWGEEVFNARLIS